MQQLWGYPTPYDFDYDAVADDAAVIEEFLDCGDEGLTPVEAAVYLMEVGEIE